MSNVTLSATSSANSNSAVTFAANTLPTGVSLSGNTIFGTPTTEQTVYSTLTATATQTGRTATRFVSWVVSISDLFFKYNTLAIQGADTTFVDDASTNNFAVTIAGDTKPNSFNPYTPGYYSNYFDGTGDWLTIPNNTGFAFGSGAFTVEMWVYIAGSSGTVANYSNGQSSNSNFAWELYQVNTTTMQFSVFEGATQYISSSTSFKQNAWNHIACVRSSNTLTTYVNGVAGGTTANVTGVSISDPASATLKLCSYGNGSSYVTGYISNFRVVKGTAVYTAAFTPSTTPLTAISGTSVLTCQSNRFIDNSDSTLTITVTGNTLISSFDPFVPNSSYSTYGSGYFDGTGDYLTIPSSSEFTFGTGDFTVEGWAYVTGHNGAGANGIFQQGPTSFPLSTTNTVAFGTFSTGQVWQIYAKNTNTNSSATWMFNTWYHFAVVRSSGTTNLYINGVAVITVTSDTTNYTGTHFGIGSLYGTGYSQLGYISDVRVVKGTAVYTSAFTPPSAPLTAISGTSLLTLQNNQPVNNSTFLDNSTNNLPVTYVGKAVQGTFSPYGSNWSNYFGGQMVSTLSPSSTNFNLTGDFTLEAYVFLTALPGGDWGILDARTAGASPTSWLFGFNGSGKMQYYDGTARVGATTITLNTWHHVSWVRNGSVLRAYLNGVLDYYNGSYGTSAISPGSTAPVIGTKDYGISAAWGTTGYISNLRVVNGTAVYTTSSTTVGTTIFTPSTTPLTPIANTTLLTCADSRFIDDSINNYTITPSSTTISAQRFSPFNPSSVTPTSYSGYFDGTGDYLTVTNNVAFTFTNDFTIECWIYSGSNVPSNDAYPTIFSTSAFNSTGIGLKIQSSGGVGTTGVACVWNNGSQILTGTTVISNNNWYHLSVSRSGTSMKLFVNGVAENTITNNTTFTVSAGYPLVGGDTTIAGFLTGYVSNARIVKGTAVYTSNFTPSTTPLTAIANTSLLTCQSPTFIDNSTNNFTISAFGNSKPTIQNPFGYTSATTNGYTVSTIGGSGYSNATGTVYSNIASPIAGNANAWTMECWVYFNTISGNVFIMGLGNNTGGTTPYLDLRISSTTVTLEESSTVSGIWAAAATFACTVGQWYHFAATRSGSTIRLFINGVQLASTTYASAIQSGLKPFTNGLLFSSGTARTDGVNGYVSDTRMIAGTALYTSNFVPPSAPLTAIQNTSWLINATSAGIYDAAMMTTMETVGDAKLSTAVSKFGGTSMYFDGTGDYLSMPTNQMYAFGTGDFTIEGWLYFTGNQNFGPMFISSTTGAGNALHIQINNANKVRVTNETTEFLLATNAISLSTWTHIAVVRSGTTLSIYQNGTLNGSTTNSTNFIQNGALVGLEPTGGSFYYAGYIDDLRITKGYARYTSNFTAPITTFKIK